MDFKKYTIKSQEAIQKAAEIASGNQQQAIEPGHLLKAILLTDENVVSFLLKKLGVNKGQLDARLEEIINSYPKVSGQQPYLSNDAHAALTKALDHLKEFGDEFVAIEHIMLGLLKGKEKVGILLKELGFAEKHLVAAIKELRGGNSVTDPNAEAKYQSLNRYSKNLNELARSGKIDPVIGRDEEIRRVLQILSRRTNKQPYFTGRTRSW